MPVSLAAGSSQSMTGAMQHIATGFGTYDSPSISFVNIPQTFQELYVVMNGVQSLASGGMTWAYNSNYVFTYSQTRMYGTAGTIATDRQTTVAPLGPSFGGGTFNINPYTTHIHIIDYASTNKFKQCLMKMGTERNGSGEIHYLAGLWPNTAGINRIDFNINNAGMWTTTTSISLYGIKAGG